jgi:Rrf2 family iron-sulfur cluster assembly transcriptional regulator
LTHYLWEDLSEQIHGFLQNISLADLVARNEVKRIAENQDHKQSLVADGVDLKVLADRQIPATTL